MPRTFAMSNSWEPWYTCVGHLFENADDKSQSGYKTVLSKVVSQVYVSTDSMVDRNGFQQFEIFFNNVTINFDSANRYLCTKLKLPAAENVQFELKVERSVWAILIESNTKFNQTLKNARKHIVDRKEGSICFQLFCLFNRFSESRRTPMMIEDDAIRFLFKKIGIPCAEGLCLIFRFQHFLECVYKRLDPIIIEAIRNAYDEYVRDVVFENGILFRLRARTGKQGESQKVRKGI